MIKTAIKLLVLFILIFSANIKASANSHVENDLGLWTSVYIKLPVSEKIKTSFEVHPRIQNNITHINQLLLRPSVGYQVNKNLSLWQGYGWITNYIPRFAREQRTWQQVLYEKEFSRFTFSSRFRFEERFIQDVEGVSLRGRDLIKFVFPLNKKKDWGLVLSDELFVNLISHFHGPQAGIDQNRLFVGLSKKISENVKLEGGYQLQYINNNSPKADRLNHIIRVNMYFTLPQLLKD